MKTTTAVIIVLALVAFVGTGWWYYSGKMPAQPQTEVQPIATVAFACDAGKSIGAAFYESSVALNLSDGRALTLPQMQSASGVRYASTDESFVFLGKGNTAFVEEGAAQEQTYKGCLIVSPDPSGLLTQVYATSSAGFTVRFPEGYTADPNYKYQALGPGKSISGVKLTVSQNLATGTNLSRDSYISVEWLPTATPPAGGCSATLFLDSKKEGTFSDAGIDYSVATSSGAAAGNIYDEAVFAIPDTSPCTAVRYFIHSTQIGNYPAGTVVEFDKAKIITEFDFIRRSLVLGR